MVIQWYPGHMTKARRAMEEDVKKVDLLIELLDARIPLSSRNPDIDRIAKDKFRLILLNKADLADETVTDQWRSYFTERGIRTIAVDARAKNVLKLIREAVPGICREKIEKDRKRGFLNVRIKAMVAGIPNVGKSTFINSMAGRTAAKTGNLPGVTRGNQWIRLNESLDLLDTPGILWPKFDDETVGTNLALTGAVRPDLVDPSELCSVLLNYLKTHHFDLLVSRYGVTEEDRESSAFDLLSRIALLKGCVKKQACPDTERMAKQMLDAFKNGKLGRITLEAPPEKEAFS